MALIESGDNIILSPSEVKVGEAKVKVFPFPVKKDKISRITASNLHEWTEQTLQRHYEVQENIPRFMSDGIAEVIKLEDYKTLNDKTKEMLIPDKKSIANMINHSRKYWDEAASEGIKGFNIGEWQYGSMSYSVFHKSQPLGYSSSMAFWYYAIKECGSDIVKKVVSETLKMEKFNYTDVALLLTKYNTNTDWIALITFFPMEKMYWFYEEIAKLFGI